MAVEVGSKCNTEIVIQVCYSDPESEEAMTNKDKPDEDEEEFRLGRLSTEEEYLYNQFGARIRYRRRSHRKSQMVAPRSGRSSLSQKALNLRSLVATDQWRPDGPQAIVKSVRTTKSKKGVRNMVRYVSRREKEDGREGGFEPVQLHDEYGTPFASTDPLQHLQSWDLLEDEQNLSKAERDRRKGLTPRPLKERRDKEKLCNIQGWHFVLSIRSDGDSEKEVQALTRAARATVDVVFTQKGHRVIWGIHTDQPSHPHAHLIVEAKSQFGPRIQCDRAGDYLHSIRTTFARHLRLAGLSYQATRREDRRSVRKAILCGDERLRNNIPLADYKRPKHHLRDRCPNWYAEYSSTLAQNAHHAGEIDHKEAVRQPSMLKWNFWRIRREERECPGEYQELYRTLGKVYENHMDALKSWVALAGEGAVQQEDKLITPNRSFALWYLTKRPETFGKLRPGWASGEDYEHCLNVARETPIKPRTVLGNGLQSGPITDDRGQQICRDRIQLTASLRRLALQTHHDLQNPIRAKQIQDNLISDLAAYRSGFSLEPEVAINPGILRKKFSGDGGTSIAGGEARQAQLSPTRPSPRAQKKKVRGRQPGKRRPGPER